MSDGMPRAVRFVRAETDFTPELCEAVVEFASVRGETYSAGAQGGTSETDQLRAVARAAADALSEMFEPDGVRVRVIGVQLVEAFAQRIVVVSLAASKGVESLSLLGVSDGSEDLVRATAIAVLNATNRFLARQ